jgi:hypothetical protein
MAVSGTTLRNSKPSTLRFRHGAKVTACLGSSGSSIVSTLRSRRLVADLDRTMTVEKAVVAKWPRTAGCRTDEDVRRFSMALARKRARLAFPDDFTACAQKLQTRLQEKHDK